MKTLPYKFVLIGLVVLFAASAQLFFYKAYIEPRRQAASDLQLLAQMLRIEAASAPTPAENLPDGGTSVPVLLNRVQELAASYGVAVRRLAPVAAEPDHFDMELSANFVSLVRFLARFETLNVAIASFEIEPPVIGEDDALRMAVQFARAPPQGPARLEHADAFLASLDSAPARDPFGSWSAPVTGLLEMSGNDLTWVYHLTSISQIGDMRIATIDGEDFGIGEMLDGRIIDDIGEDSVTLLDDRNDTLQQFVLRFRSLPGDGT